MRRDNLWYEGPQVGHDDEGGSRVSGNRHYPSRQIPTRDLNYRPTVSAGVGTNLIVPSRRPRFTGVA